MEAVEMGRAGRQEEPQGLWRAAETHRRQLSAQQSQAPVESWQAWVRGCPGPGAPVSQDWLYREEQQGSCAGRLDSLSTGQGTDLGEARPLYLGLMDSCLL